MHKFVKIDLLTIILNYKNLYLIHCMEENIIKESLPPNTQQSVSETNYYLISFDFDNTITTEHVTSEIINSRLDDNTLIAESFRGMNLHMLVPEMKKFRSNGNKIIIVSYNEKKLIEEVLIHFGILDLFDKIITPEMLCPDLDVSDDDTKKKLYGKNKLIQYYDNKIIKSNVLLIDDDYVNCEYALMEGYNIFHVNHPSLSLCDAKNLIVMMESCNFNTESFSRESDSNLLYDQTIISISPANEYVAVVVKQLFENINPTTGQLSHIFTPERHRWIYNWLGKCSNHGENCYVMEQLISLWNIPTFNPFMDIKSAENYIHTHQNEHVVRLSTTKPSHISITYFKKSTCKPQSIRIFIDEHHRVSHMWGQFSTYHTLKADSILNVIAKWKIDIGISNLNRYYVTLPCSEQSPYVSSHRHNFKTLSRTSEERLLFACHNVEDPITRNNITDINPNKMIFIHVEDIKNFDDTSGCINYNKPTCVERIGLENCLLKQLERNVDPIVEYTRTYGNIFIGRSVHGDDKLWYPMIGSEVYIKLPLDFTIYIKLSDMYILFNEVNNNVYVRLRGTDGIPNRLKLGSKYGRVRGEMQDFYVGTISLHK